jgi:hypothetical protein
LQAGDAVVTDGQDKLQNGAKVEPRTPTRSPNAPQSTPAAPAS